MEDEVKTLVGYWNGDEENPDIIFTTPTEQQSQYKLVVIEIIQPFENDEVVDVPEVNRATNRLRKCSTVLKKNTRKIEDVNKSLRKLTRLTKRFK